MPSAFSLAAAVFQVLRFSRDDGKVQQEHSFPCLIQLFLGYWNRFTPLNDDFPMQKVLDREARAVNETLLLAQKLALWCKPLLVVGAFVFFFEQG